MAEKSKIQILGAHVAVWCLKRVGTWSDCARFRLSVGLAWVATRVAKRRMHIARTNLRTCFPEWNADQIEVVARQQMRYFAQAVVDRSVFWFGSEQAIYEHITLQDEHFLTEALAQNRPVILLAPHFVGLDAGGTRINMQMPLVSMYKKQSNPVFDKMVLEGRMRSGQVHLYSKDEGVRKLVKLLKTKIPVYYLPDMDFGIKDALFSTFFNQPAATLTALPKLAALTGALVVPCITRIDPQAAKRHETRYITQFYPVWQDYPEADEAAAVLRMNQFIETQIELDPAQYLWMHKRFKTRPEGMAGIY